MPMENALEKENVAPLAKLKSSQRAFGQVLKPRSVSPHDQFLADIENYAGNDPLKPWTEYITWLGKQPNSQQALEDTLAQCTNTFIKDARYKNAMPYLRLWIMRADGVEQPLEVFSILRQEGIGLQSAMFYQALALVLENQESFKDADSVYMEGMMVQAQPLPSLLQAYRDFKDRLTQHQQQEQRVIKEQETKRKVEELQQALTASARKNKQLASSAQKPQAKRRKVVTHNNGTVGAYAPEAIEYNGNEICFEEHRARLLQEKADQHKQALLNAQKPLVTPSRSAAPSMARPVEVRPPEPVNSSSKLSCSSKTFPKSSLLPSAPSPAAPSPCFRGAVNTSGCGSGRKGVVASPNIISSSPTINTKAALNAVYAMFNDSPMMGNALMPPAPDAADVAQVSSAKQVSEVMNSSALNETTGAVGAFMGLANGLGGEDADETCDRSQVEFCTSSLTAELGNDRELIQGRRAKLRVSTGRPRVSPVAFTVFSDETTEELSSSTPKAPSSSPPMLQSSSVSPSNNPPASSSSSAVLQPSPVTRVQELGLKEKQDQEETIEPVKTPAHQTPPVAFAIFCDEENNTPEPQYENGGTPGLTPILETSREGSEMSKDTPQTGMASQGPFQAAAAATAATASVATVDPFDFNQRIQLMDSLDLSSFEGVVGDGSGELPAELDTILAAGAVTQGNADLELGDRFFHVEDVLAVAGEGVQESAGNSITLGVQDLDGDDEAADLVLKVSRGPAGMEALWEFYIGAVLSKRFSGPNHSASFIVPNEIHVLRGCACLLSQRSHQRHSLQDVLRLQAKRGKPMPEPLAIFYCIEMARCVAALHRAQVLHCAVTAAAFLVRDTTDASLEWEEWTVQRVGSWQHKGLALGFFQKAVDMSLFAKGTAFQAAPTATTDATQCAELRTGEPWREQVDAVAMAGVLHQLLFNEALPELGSTERRLSTPCPAGYDEKLWGEVFSLLLSVGRRGECEGSVAALGKLQHLMEAAIVGRKNWGKKLKVLLCQQSYALCDGGLG